MDEFQKATIGKTALRDTDRSACVWVVSSFNFRPLQRLLANDLHLPGVLLQTRDFTMFSFSPVYSGKRA